MSYLKKPILAIGVGAAMLCATAIQPAVAEVGFGKPGDAVNLVVGYQPYYRVPRRGNPFASRSEARCALAL